MSRNHAVSAPTITTKPFPWIGLLSLSAAVFLSVTSEMLPTGLLPEMSRSLGVTQSQVGLLLSWFAFTVVATSAPLAYVTRRMPRHGLMMVVLVVFAGSNLLTAIAPTYELLVASRVLGGMAHGLFWAVVGAYAAHLVPKEQIGRAVSVTIAGGTLAFIFGVPIATAAGQIIGWQLSFVAIAVLMLAATALVWRFLPPVTHYAGETAERQEAGVASAEEAGASGISARSRRDPTAAAVALICIITAITMVGHYTLYTYIAPFFTEQLGVDAAAVAPLLFAYGIAGAGGLVLSGTVFGPRPKLGLVIGLAVSALGVIVLAVYTSSAPVAIVAFLLWGVAFGTLPPLLQTRLLHTASPRIRDISSAFFTTSFNIGIGGGALLGSVLLDMVGLEVMPFVYVGILIVSLVLVLITDLVRTRRANAR
ncbi:MAG TPA: MFS transporter [Glaciibacter sp.]|nr:MFS transporter [Glaciibacter sp.]